jgi:hypothetical protein
MPGQRHIGVRISLRRALDLIGCSAVPLALRLAVRSPPFMSWCSVVAA